MTRSIIWAPRAIRDLRKLPKETVARVRAGVATLAAANQGDVRKLRDQDDEWRLRIGDIRVRFTIRDGGRTLEVLRVRRRDKAYRD